MGEMRSDRMGVYFRGTANSAWGVRGRVRARCLGVWFKHLGEHWCSYWHWSLREEQIWNFDLNSSILRCLLYIQ